MKLAVVTSAIHFGESKQSLKSFRWTSKYDKNCDSEKNEISETCWEDHNFNWDENKVNDIENSLISRNIKDITHSLKTPSFIKGYLCYKTILS